MAAEPSRDRPWAAAICTVCGKYFTEPVSLECGHNFCRSCITWCWEEFHADITCPRWCYRFLEGRKFEPNRELADFVEATKQLVERVKEEASCTEHQKPLNLFCEDDQAAICELCKTSKAHRNHRVVGVEFQRQIGAYMNIPHKMRSDFSIYSCNAEKMTQEWLKRTEAERKKTVAEFKHLRQFLDEQENLRLARLVELEKEIMRKMNEYEKNVTDQITFLDDVYDRMEDVYKDREFLQEFGGGLYGYDEKRWENPLPLPTELKDKMQKFCDRKLFLEEVRKEFNDEIDALLKGRRRKRARTEAVVEARGARVDVILDPDTANHSLTLSADRRTVCYGTYRYFPPTEPKRFYFIPCVLGRPAFTSGRHWWEVKVEGSGLGWAVGVARESVKRDDLISFWDTEGIWVVGKQSSSPASPRRLLAYSYPATTLLILTRKPEKIRVCLDYPGGQVAFFNAETDESIFVFRSCSFLGEKVYPLFWVFSHSITLSC